MTATLDTSPYPASYTPGQIPEDDKHAPPSVWGPGDVHHTMEQIWDESPAGVAAAGAPDPKDREIARLNAELAVAKGAPDPRDVEIARLKAKLQGDDNATFGEGVEATATTVDPRDTEIAELKAQLEAK